MLGTVPLLPSATPGRRFVALTFVTAFHSTAVPCPPPLRGVRLRSGVRLGTVPLLPSATPGRRFVALTFVTAFHSTAVPCPPPLRGVRLRSGVRIGTRVFAGASRW